MEVTGLLLEQGPTYGAVLCPGDLGLADNIQIPIFKIKSRAQCFLREGLEDECFKGWKGGFGSQALGTQSGGSGGARDEIWWKDLPTAQRAGGLRPRAGRGGNPAAQPARASASPCPCGRRRRSRAEAAIAVGALGRGGIAQRKGKFIPRTNLCRK